MEWALAQVAWKEWDQQQQASSQEVEVCSLFVAIAIATVTPLLWCLG